MSLTIKKLAAEIAKIEGKKSEARIGDIREILGIISDIFYAFPEEVAQLVFENGMKRAKRLAKKK